MDDWTVELLLKHFDVGDRGRGGAVSNNYGELDDLARSPRWRFAPWPLVTGDCWMATSHDPSGNGDWKAWE